MKLSIILLLLLLLNIQNLIGIRYTIMLYYFRSFLLLTLLCTKY